MKKEAIIIKKKDKYIIKVIDEDDFYYVESNTNDYDYKIVEFDSKKKAEEYIDNSSELKKKEIPKQLNKVILEDIFLYLCGEEECDLLRRKILESWKRLPRTIRIQFLNSLDKIQGMQEFKEKIKEKEIKIMVEEE